MSSKLLSLPKAIRDQIFLLVLRSFTGKISLSAYGDRFKVLEFSSFPQAWSLYDQTHGTISLALTSTCKQIHTETKDLLWEANTVCFSPERLPYYGKVHLERLHGVRNVVMRLEWSNYSPGSELNLFENGMKTCEMWAREGNLDSLTIWSSVRSGTTNPDIAQKCVKHYLDALKKYRGVLCGVKRKIVFEMTWWRSLFEWFLKSFMTLDKFLEDVHLASGLLVETDNVVIWKDGKKVANLEDIREEKGPVTPGGSSDEEEYERA